MADLVRVETDEGVTRLTLDSPRNRNALSTALLDELLAGLAGALADDTVRTIVLTGEGPVFCAGADIKEQRAYRERGQRSPVVDQLAQALTTIVASAKPVLARVNGSARAGGLGLIGACDIAIAPVGATFGFAEVRLGIVPAVIAVTTVPRMSGRAALELFLTGETFDAQRAVDIGLLNRAVAEDQLDDEVDRYLGMLRLGGPEALARIKPLITRVRELPPADAFLEMARLSSERFASEEGQEGLRAFAEKRPPSWVGRRR